MKMLGVILTDLDHFEDEMLKIQKAEPPENFSQEFLETLGFQRPNSVLYIDLFHTLGLINADGTPKKSFSRFSESESSARKVIKEKLKEGYSELYDLNKDADKLPEANIKELCEKLLKGKKTDSTIQMVVDTHMAIAGFATTGNDVLQEEDRNNHEFSKNDFMVIKGLMNKADLLERLKRYDEALSTIDQLIGYYQRFD